MHIELTDLLRCPAEHPEAFLVLLPARMEGREVVAGHLGCPVCGWSTDWSDGVPILGQAAPATNAPPITAAELLALLGLEGPGGWVVLEGSFGMLAPELATALPDVKLVAVNSPRTMASFPGLSIVRSRVWPIKRHVARGVVVESSGMQEGARGSALPGLRIVGAGPPPQDDAALEVLASTPALWVARHR